MSLSPSVLLPSQEALLQRMQHLVCYSHQLLVIQGALGAGKTTLLTALVSELEDYNSALVICPKHADAAEIRRKILIQLQSSPLFDDEDPLGDTLLRLCGQLTKPIHIVIDDAQLLPLEIWAECLLLGQLSCAGRPIAVTLASEPGASQQIDSQLTSSQRQLMQVLEIDPLPVAEREALYYTLISRSDAVPYVPRDIIKSRLEEQQGLPAEVISLLELAMLPGSGEPQADKRRRRVALVLAVTVLILGALWSYVAPPPIDDGASNGYGYQPTGLLIPFGQARLQGYFAERDKALALSQQLETMSVKQASADSAAAEPQESLSDAALLAEAEALAAVETAETLAANQNVANAATTATVAESGSTSVVLGAAASLPSSGDRRNLDAHGNPRNQAELATRLGESANAVPHKVEHAAEQGSGPKNQAQASPVIGEMNKTSDTGQLSPRLDADAPAVKGQPAAQDIEPTAVTADEQLTAGQPETRQENKQVTLPQQGYTLQLATVNQRASADAILRRMAVEPELRLLRYQGKLVVLQGNYASLEAAQAQAKRLSQIYGGGKPWVRAWKDLHNYQPLGAESGGEISN